MAVVFAVLDLGRPVSSVSLVVVARSAPQLAFVVFGGVIADRPRRRLVLIVASTIAALSQGTLACMVGFEHASLGVLMALSVINGTAAAMSGPAAGAIFRSIVSSEDWQRASVLDRGGMQLGLLLGLSSGGILISTLGPAFAIGVDAATFGVAGLCYLMLSDPGPSGTTRAAFLEQLGSGFSYFRRRGWLVVITLQTLVTGVAFAAGLQVLAPVVADATFGRASLGVAGSFQVAGAMIGVALAGVLPNRSRLGCTITMSGAVAAPLMCFAIAPMISAQMLMIIFSMSMFVTGCCGELAGIWENVVTLRHVSPDMIGRVGSFMLLASIGGLPLGEAIAAPLHGLLGLRGAYLSLITVVLLVVLIGIRMPAVRRLDDQRLED
jgi:MFS family permease